MRTFSGELLPLPVEPSDVEGNVFVEEFIPEMEPVPERQKGVREIPTPTPLMPYSELLVLAKQHYDRDELDKE
jgi:hypothetical protein